MVEIAIAFFCGWVFARADDILAAFKERQGHRERMLLFDKALSGGNPVDLYNFRVADQVSQDKGTVRAAVAKEVGRTVLEEEQAPEPWAADPLYGRCEVQIDLQAGVFHIFDPDAPDGPDTWTEEIDPFMAKWEINGADTTTGR